MTPVAVRRTNLDQTSAHRAPDVDGAVKRTAHSPEDDVDIDTEPSSSTLLPTKNQSKEAEDLARELGVTVERLPLVIDQFERSIDDRVAQLHDREGQIARAMESINKAESNPLAMIVPAEMESSRPELASLRARRQQLLTERARLATYLKPAHPEFQALDRDLKEAETSLRQEQQGMLTALRQDVHRWDAEVKSLRESIVADRERLAVVSKMIGLSEKRTGEWAPAPNPVTAPALVGETAAPLLSAPAVANSMSMPEKPIGRVDRRRSDSAKDVSQRRDRGGDWSFDLHAVVSHSSRFRSTDPCR
jgi:predicted  nucleic acid-binding Zn-ribbon protein